MPFRNDLAADTLNRALDDLIRAWPDLRADVRSDLEGWVQTHGPRIGNYGAANHFNVVSQITACLEELWLLRDRLPAGAVGILQAGQGLSGPGSLADAEREALLHKMVAISDFRVYHDPKALAAKVDTLVDRFRARLTPDEQSGWQALHDAFSAGGDATIYLRAAEKLLGGYPKVRETIEPHKLWTPGPVFRGTETRDYSAPEPAVISEEVTRHANVNFPNKVLVTQQEVPLVIHVAGKHVDTSQGTAESTRMTLRVGPLQIVLRADGFAVMRSIGGEGDPLAPHSRQVQVQAGRDCEPVIFFLTPQSTGPKRMSLDFYQGDRPILNLPFDTEVVADLSQVTRLAAASVPQAELASAVRAKVDPPDLELRVMLGGDKRSLSYYLHSPGGADYNFKYVGTADLGADPLIFLKGTFDRLSTLAKLSEGARSAADTARSKDELADIGHSLYDSLFPADTCRFKQEYAKTIRTRYVGKGLLITSDDPWIPWEMVRPRESDEDGQLLYDDAPLCEEFLLTRWLAGRGAPDQVKMAQGTLVAPPDNLQAAQDETNYFAELWRQQWQISFGAPDRFVPLVSLAQVQDAFARGSTQLFHFACHGNFNTDDPNESKLKLGAEFLRPNQITGARADGLKRAKPVVFLNACHSGRVGFGLTQLGGWAQRFLDLGASAFIGSLWEVNDKLAAQFAVEFYNRLWGLAGFAQQDLGQAFYEARMAIKAADEANPTWLAYVLYGDPYGQVLLGEK